MIGEAQPRYALSPVDGCPVFYDIVDPGTDSAVTLVMCDGIGCDGYVWKHLRRALAPEYRLIHWHYPGHGRSPMPRDSKRTTIAGLAQDLVGVLDDAGIERVVACGHSMGVQVVLEAYRQASSRIDGLILVCGAAENPLRTFRGTDRFEALLPRVRRMAQRAPWIFNRLSRRILPTRLAYEIATLIEPNEALLERRDFMPYLEGMARVDVRLFISILEAACAHSAVDLLDRIQAPTLIIAGEQDSFTPLEVSERMHASIPESELVVIQGGSHTSPIERPAEVNDAVIRFLDRRLRNLGRENPSQEPSAVPPATP